MIRGGEFHHDTLWTGRCWLCCPGGGVKLAGTRQGLQFSQINADFSEWPGFRSRMRASTCRLCRTGATTSHACWPEHDLVPASCNKATHRPASRRGEPSPRPELAGSRLQDRREPSPEGLPRDAPTPTCEPRAATHLLISTRPHRIALHPIGRLQHVPAPCLRRSICKMPFRVVRTSAQRAFCANRGKHETETTLDHASLKTQP